MTKVKLKNLPLTALVKLAKKKYNIEYTGDDKEHLLKLIKAAKTMKPNDKATAPMGKNMVAPKSVEEHVVGYIKALRNIENKLTECREEKSDLRRRYIKASYLSKEDIKRAVTAYKFLREDENVDTLLAYYKKLRVEVG